MRCLSLGLRQGIYGDLIGPSFQRLRFCGLLKHWSVNIRALSIIRLLNILLRRRFIGVHKKSRNGESTQLHLLTNRCRQAGLDLSCAGRLWLGMQFRSLDELSCGICRDPRRTLDMRCAISRRDINFFYRFDSRLCRRWRPGL